LASHEESPYTEDFLGVEMYWSNYDLQRYEAMLDALGYTVEERGMLGGGAKEWESERHPFVLARTRA
jgi:hypothetical protein